MTEESEATAKTTKRVSVLIINEPKEEQQKMLIESDRSSLGPIFEPLPL